MLEIYEEFWEQSEIMIFSLTAKIIQKSYKCCQIFTGHLSLRILVCYAFIFNPIAQIISYKRRKLYENVIYLMRELDTAEGGYIKSFNKSYYYIFNSYPSQPVH